MTYIITAESRKRGTISYFSVGAKNKKEARKKFESDKIKNEKYRVVEVEEE